MSTISTAPDSISVNPGVLCIGSGVTISREMVVTRRWWTMVLVYRIMRRYFSIGTGIVITDLPQANTMYYLRAEGTCNTTICSTNTVRKHKFSDRQFSHNGTFNCLFRFSDIFDIKWRIAGYWGSWHWYKGSCGGTVFGVGSTIIDNPVVNTTYYVRGEGACNTTNCLSTILTINTNSMAATGTIGTPSILCTGLPSTLTLNGGFLGAGSAWIWYIGSCGGTYAGNDSSLTVFPTVTTEYYVRAENVCNSTSCVSEIITVNDSSVSVTLLTALNDTICQGSFTNLSLTGGSLGTSAGWYWYTGSCGGTAAGIGNTITVDPMLTTSYYLRAEGICNTTNCVNHTVTVNNITASATGMILGNDTICENSSTTLGVTGGSLGNGANWYWYSGYCGGLGIGFGPTVTVSPTVTTGYYVRGEGICNTTGCISNLLTVNDSSRMAISVTTILDSVCEGTSTGLGVSGGVLGASADWYWYSGSCGGTLIGNGSMLTVNPGITTDYFVRAEGFCNTTLCKDIIVTVFDSSISASSITASLSTICAGNTTTLSFTGGLSGTGAYWLWFTGACGGNGIGIGATIVDNPILTTMYYLRSEGICNTTVCVSFEIIVNSNYLVQFPVFRLPIQFVMEIQLTL